MFSQDDDGQLGLVLTVVLGLVALVIALLIALVIGLRVDPRGASADRAPAVPVTATAPDIPMPQASSVMPADISRSAAQAVADAASVKVEYGVVKFYFASGKADLAAGAGEAMADLVKAARSGHKLVVAGFHDATGDAEKNAGLARQRALAVRDALKAAGVAEQQIELKKPEPMAGSGSGSDAEARRVEINIR